MQGVSLDSENAPGVDSGSARSDSSRRSGEEAPINERKALEQAILDKLGTLNEPELSALLAILRMLGGR